MVLEKVTDKTLVFCVALLLSNQGYELSSGI